MSKYQTGSFTSSGSAAYIHLGWLPTKFVVYNYTMLATPTNAKIAQSMWIKGMANYYAVRWLWNATPVMITDAVTSNGFFPYTTGTGSIFATTRKTITDITRVTHAVVTSATHGLAAGDVVTFSGVVGMTEINFLRGHVLTVPTANTFSVDIDTTGFTAYGSGGTANLISSTQYNVGVMGMEIGTSVVGETTNVMYWEAFQEDPIL